MEIQPLVVGTAGHIDHGKSTLVRALTGIDPDRLKEEKERGLTIDLGFARFSLPDGRTVGLVDVPGHERFIKNMVAGASGIDLVILVVAADDGVMPQTREHLAIMELFGVSRGFVALTKIDAVDAELVELAALDITEFLAGTFLEGTPILPISAKTGEGMDELRSLLFALCDEIEPRSAEGGVFRMPVQRVFTKKGFGTILTGIPLGGRCELGQALEVQPGGMRGKVRSIQAYGSEAQSAQAGHSSAINLTDIDHGAVHRGAVVSTPGYFQPVSMVGAKLRALRTLPRAIQNRSRVRVHTGTAETVGDLVLLDVEALEPGGEALCQLRLDEPIVVAPGDRYVLRLASPMITLGGGVIIEESRWRLKRFKSFVADELGRQAESLESTADLTLVLLERASDLVSTEDIAKGVKRSIDEVRPLLEKLRKKGRIRADASGAKFVHSKRLQRAREAVFASVESWFAESAHLQQVEAIELRRRSGLDAGLFDVALRAEVEAGRLKLATGGMVLVPGREARLSEEERRIYVGLREHLDEARFQPPTPPDLAETLKAPEKKTRAMLAALVDAGEATRVGGDLFFSAKALEEAKAVVTENCERNGELVIPELRDALGTSRKFLIPILEWFDARGLTLRQGGRRVLKRR